MATKKRKTSSPQPEENFWWNREPEEVFLSLISPHDVDDFFKRCWERAPAIIRHAGEARKSFGDLFSRKILDKIARQEAIEYGLHLNACRYVNGRRENLSPAGGRATSKEIWHMFDKEQATLQFHQPQQYQVSIHSVYELSEPQAVIVFRP